MSATIPVVVNRLYGLPPLVIEDGLGLARFFFENDASALGDDSYDAWVAAGPRDRFVRHDIEIVNGPMRARSPYEAWTPLLSDPAPSWLAGLGASWDLVGTDDVDWATDECAQRLEAAIVAMQVKGVGRAVATKVLHMKRPRLVPILDSLVVQTVGGRTDEFPTATSVVIAHLRKIARDNAGELVTIANELADLPIRPSLARILDALLWTANPRSSLHADLGWTTRLGPGTPERH